jgi:hypothetical protein
MAKPKKAAKRGPVSRQIQLSASGSPFQLVSRVVPAGVTPDSAAPTPVVAKKAADPTGEKGYIAFSVAHSLYPQGAGINPDQDISDDTALNSDMIATEINVDAQHSAVIHQLTWTLVTAADVAKLKTVMDLVNLVISNLADEAAGNGT